MSLRKVKRKLFAFFEKKLLVRLFVLFSVSLLVGCSKNNSEKEKIINENIVQTSTNAVEIGDTECDKQEDFLIEIDKNNLIDYISNSDDVWVYVGRPNCKDCQKFYPRLYSYLKENGLKILYLNTRVKTSLKKELVTFLAENDVDEVPAIMHWNNSKVERVFDMQQDEDIKMFEKEYLEYGGYLNYETNN